MLPVETFHRLVKRRVDAVRGDHGLADTKAKQAASEFRHWFDPGSGMGRFAGSLDPERYELLANAIEHHATALAAASDETVTKDANLAARSARPRTATTWPRPRSPGWVVTQCYAGSPSTRPGVPVNVGRKYRTAIDTQWAALKALYASCGWDGCEAPISWCQAHHITEWEHGGPTDLDNLIPLCSRHHHRVHEGQWRLKLLPDRTLEIHRPDGTHHQTVPPPKRC